MRRLLFIFAFFCILWASAFGIYCVEAQETERILSFDSYIEVCQDSTLQVRETIRVYSFGVKIKRGIYRDFPTTYTDRYGNKHIVGFKVLEVLRDGKPEQYRIEPHYNGVRIYIGNPNYYLPRGEYTYILEYITTRQLGFFKEHDELYWNVTGNDWDFLIERAKATVVLPEGASSNIISKKGYTGYQSSREEAVDIYGNVTFVAFRPLLPREGLTIAVSWPKGYVREPTFTMRAGYFLSDNRTILLSFLGLLIILGYYLITWHYIGRDPAKGTIIPLFHPPKDLTPAAVRYIKRMGYDNKVFTAAILNMAVKGYLAIEESKNTGLLKFGKTYIIKKTGKDESMLTPEEAVVARRLLGAYGEIELKNENHTIIRAAIFKLQRALKKKTEKIYFLTNRGFFGLGIVITIFFGIITFVFSGHSGGSIILLFSSYLLMILLNVLFYYLLKAPTFQGRRIMDQIEGFKMFLSVTEKERLNLLNPPERTPELFERYLPFALALDVEQRWAEQFTEVFARIAQQGKEYYPVWYSGSSWSGFNTGGFAQSLGSAFSNAIASSSVPPGSSSGFGGGGGSGGGGGGGGGGGW